MVRLVSGWAGAWLTTTHGPGRFRVGGKVGGQVGHGRLVGWQVRGQAGIDGQLDGGVGGRGARAVGDRCQRPRAASSRSRIRAVPRLSGVGSGGGIGDGLAVRDRPAVAGVARQDAGIDGTGRTTGRTAPIRVSVRTTTHLGTVSH